MATNPVNPGKSGAGPTTICISSGKGGVGKTSISVNTATALAASGRYKVLLIDGDLGLANVDIVLGLNVRHTVQETIDDDQPLAKILVEITPGFFVLPATSGVPEMANLSFEEQSILMEALEKIIDRFDFVLIDTAAGLGDSVLWFNQWARLNIIILSPDPTSMTDAYALMKVLTTQYGKNDFKLLINNVQSRKEGQAVFASMSRVLANFLKITPDYLGALPQDSNVSKAIRMQKPFLLSFPECRASVAIKEIAATIAAM